MDATGRASVRDAAELLELAQDLASQAGALLLEGLPRHVGPLTTKSSATDVVTELDRASEALIVSGITRARPDDAIVGEEGSRRLGSSGVRWMIDPLDGTTNYLYGQPAFSVSIAVELDGSGPVVGVVADPSHGETFTAVRGGGARCNARPVSASTKTDLATALVATGFSYRSERRAAQARVLTSVLPAVRDIRRMGSAALDLCWVACGRLDGYYERGLQPWDFAAGALIAVEAGAYVALADDRPGEQLALACAPGLAAALTELLTRAGAGGA